jgi:biopolymer transport protein ExbB/TolQ
LGILTNAFYLISTALLIPCMLALLWSLARALVLIGQLLREHTLRLREQSSVDRLVRQLEESPCPGASDWEPVVTARQNDKPDSLAGLRGRALSRLPAAGCDALLAEKIVRDAELAWQAELDRLRAIVRFGPTMGLMGTLIPLGPALVGLAAGDLESMAHNLVIAFATTVVGLLAATLASTALGIRQRWYRADALLIHFAARRLAQGRGPLRPRSASAEHSEPRAVSALVEESCHV